MVVATFIEEILVDAIVVVEKVSSSPHDRYTSAFVPSSIADTCCDEKFS